MSALFDGMSVEERAKFIDGLREDHKFYLEVARRLGLLTPDDEDAENVRALLDDGDEFDWVSYIDCTTDPQRALRLMVLREFVFPTIPEEDR